ncbi:phage tail protein, partial [Enterobacter mori]
MAFMLTLALRLGMTLQDLKQCMSAEELFLWQAYNEESPLSDA